jgi:hypothetical protein
MASGKRLVVTGGLGAMPFAGVAWQVMHYLEGFRRLGHDVTYVEDSGSWPYDPEKDTVSEDPGPALRYVARHLARCGLEDRWAYRNGVNGELHGMTESELAEVLKHADALVNVSGFTVLGDAMAAIPVRLYLETDPVLPQIEIAKGSGFTREFLAAHTHHFTYGENFGNPDCAVPIEGFTYFPTRQPVVLDWWEPLGTEVGPDQAFTTIASWKQEAKDIEWQGRVLTWSKDVQFTPYFDLPARVERTLEMSLAISDEAAEEKLRRAGWRIKSAAPLSRDIDAYRSYIRNSAGEFSVAKEQYASTRSGWFSDRTVTYLAAGRPAVVQDTGFGVALPTGEGLFAFSTADEAVAALQAIEADYARHAKAARSIAEEHLSTEVVLSRMLSDAGLD